MKINKGDKLDEITLPDKEGNTFNLSQTLGKKVLLTFYRIAGCSFCNLRLNEINNRFGELGKNFTHVGIFHSPVDNLSSGRTITWISLLYAFTGIILFMSGLVSAFGALMFTRKELALPNPTASMN